MKTALSLLALLLLGACSQPEPIVHLSAIPEAPPAVVSLPAHARYHRNDWSGDTLRVTWPSPDKALVMRYVYVHRRLRWIDVFDYAGENELDFQPKFYQILVDGRIEVPRSPHS